MYGPHVAILLMFVSRNTKRVNFRRLTGSQRTPQVWGITCSLYRSENLPFYHFSKNSNLLEFYIYTFVSPLKFSHQFPILLPVDLGQ